MFKFKKFSLTHVIIFIFFSLYAFFLLYMLGWTFLSSLNEHKAFMIDSSKFPEKLHFKNYLTAFEILTANDNSYIQMLFNSLWLTLGNSTISTLAVTLVGYALGRYNFTGKKTFLKVFIILMMIPIYGSTSAQLKMYKNLNIYDSPLFMITKFSAFGSTTLIVMSYFAGMSPAYGEAAEMDGANLVRVFLRIYMPMALPMLSAVFILAMLGNWNDYGTPIFYLPSFPTIASGLYVYEKVAKFNMNKPVYFSGIIMCAIPPLIIFAVARDKIMTSFTFGGVKE